MDAIALVVFWVSIATLVYAYAGFPLLVALVGTWRQRPVRKADIAPSVTLIIAAYNEEASIEARLDNALALDYPADRLQVLVASDGSSDRTAAIVRRYAEQGVQLLELPRRGKIHALDAAVSHATGDILVFSDANAMCDRQALRALVRNFADPEVGGVAGHTGYRIEVGSESSSLGERSYWTYDAWLKDRESRSGSVVSAHGGLYAIRRVLYERSPDQAVTDDFAISTAVVARGFRLVFEPEALAIEGAVPEAQREFRRRVRLMTRGLRGVLMRRALLNPVQYGFYAVVFASHKVIRRLAPLALVLLLATSLWLWSYGPLFQAAAAGQVLFYALAVLGGVLRRAEVGATRLLYVPFFFVMANTAGLLALVELCRGRRIELWEPQRHGTSSVRNA